MSTESPVPLILDKFLKWRGAVETGGMAKIAIQEGYVKVNGMQETRRRRKLVLGDIVEIDGNRLTVTEET